MGQHDKGNEGIDTWRREQLRQFVDKLTLDANACIRWALLDQALTDISLSAEYNNQHLEFFGDAVLRLAAAAFLREHYSQMAVGEMAAIRSQLVSDRTLTALAEKYDFSHYLNLANSAAGDQAGQASRLADAFEAVLGALYLSTDDMSLISPWLHEEFDRLTQMLQQDPARQNYKAALQELTQAHNKQLPEYRVVELSQTHGDPERFQAEVWYQGRLWGQGKGGSRKQAEQAAAEQALAKLSDALADGQDK
ncbi:MAG: ribonuclease III [Cyanobacteria bacterium J06628_6]